MDRMATRSHPVHFFRVIGSQPGGADWQVFVPP